MWRDLSQALRELGQAFKGGFAGSYRPDLHYMRGPGPKWHAKHAGFIAVPSSAKSVRTLDEAAEHRA